MAFIVTYRDKDGTAREERVEAANRAECFSKCRAKGILPMGIEESRSDGKTRRSNGDARRSNRKTRRSVLVVALVVAVLAGAGFWLWTARSKVTMQVVDEKPKKTALAKEVKPAKAPKPLEAVQAKPTNKVETVVLPDGTVTNKPKTIAEAVAMVRLKPGFHRYNSVDEVFSKTNDLQVGEYKKPLFSTHTESQLSLVATMPRDRVIPPMPPLPPNIENDFDKALASVIEIGEGEDAADARTKARVAEMKEKMQKLVKEDGMTVSQAFREIENEHNRLANMTMLYKGAYRKMVLAGDELAAEFLKKANEELRRVGACEFDENANSINP